MLKLTISACSVDGTQCCNCGRHGKSQSVRDLRSARNSRLTLRVQIPFNDSSKKDAQVGTGEPPTMP